MLERTRTSSVLIGLRKHVLTIIHTDGRTDMRLYYTDSLMDGCPFISYAAISHFESYLGKKVPNSVENPAKCASHYRLRLFFGLKNLFSAGPQMSEIRPKINLKNSHEIARGEALYPKESSGKSRKRSPLRGRCMN